MVIRYLVITLTLASRIWCEADAAGKAEPGASASPTPLPKATPQPKSNPDPKSNAQPSSDPKPTIFSAPGLPFSATPIPPFAHPSLYGPISPLTHLENKIPHFHKHSIYTPHTFPGYPQSKHLFPDLPYIDPFSSPYGKIPRHCGHFKVPLCAKNTSWPWCLVDHEYPEYEIATAIQLHKLGVLTLYADVADLSTENSVVRPISLYEETYLCPAEVAYVRPRRAINTKGHWRTIVNDVSVKYDVFTQTARLEECLGYGKSCPLVPKCYQSKCVQKSAYHRFLVFDPCHPYFPFAIESFKLPLSCSCVVGKLDLY